MVCPSCIIGVVGGYSLVRILGLNDMVSGFWIGAVTATATLYFCRWLMHRYGKRIPYQTPVILLLTLLVTSVTLYYTSVPSGVCI